MPVAAGRGRAADHGLRDGAERLASLAGSTMMYDPRPKSGCDPEHDFAIVVACACVVLIVLAVLGITPMTGGG